MLDRYNLSFDTPPEAAPAPAAASGDAKSLWESAHAIPWERDLLTLFVHNQLRVVLALPLLGLLMGLVALQWAAPMLVGLWLATVAASHAVQACLCRRYLASNQTVRPPTDWIGMLAASEFLLGATWSLPLFIFWNTAENLQHLYLIASVMAIVATRVMIAGNFMPVVLAGTGFMTVNIAVRCIVEAEPLYVALGAMAIAVEVFFIQLAQRLQVTARDMLVFKAQKEALLAELRAARDKAEDERRKAEQASSAKSSFLANMSHELRTPLNAIMGFSEILSTEMFGQHRIPAYKTYADDIHASGRHLLTLINDILDLSRIEAGRVQMREEPLVIAASVSAACHVLELKARDRRLRLTQSVPAGLPKLLADPRALHQIWLNLIANAIKFTPAGGRIEISAALQPAAGLQVTVSDTGPGIPAAEIEQLAQSFSRGSLANDKAIEGAGLGLTIVKGLAGLHGAELKIESVVGKGTAVSIHFPAQRVLTGPRGQVLSSQNLATPSQRKLIALTG